MIVDEVIPYHVFVDKLFKKENKSYKRKRTSKCDSYKRKRTSKCDSYKRKRTSKCDSYKRKRTSKCV